MLTQGFVTVVASIQSTQPRAGKKKTEELLPMTSKSKSVRTALSLQKSKAKAPMCVPSKEALRKMHAKLEKEKAACFIGRRTAQEAGMSDPTGLEECDFVKDIKEEDEEPQVATWDPYGPPQEPTAVQANTTVSNISKPLKKCKGCLSVWFKICLLYTSDAADDP